MKFSPTTTSAIKMMTMMAILRSTNGESDSGSGSSSGEEGLSCFDVLTTDATLMADLICNCNENDAALTITNGAKLTLNNYKVSCSYTTPCCELNEETYIGIKLEGQGSTVEGPGIVTESHVGIWVAGDGSHEVKDLTVRNTANDAISIHSNDNKVQNCKILDAGNGPDGDTNGDGIDIAEGASYNTIEDNVIRRAGDDGLDIDGNHNLIKNNIVAETVWEDSMTIRGHSNRIEDNTVRGSGSDGDGIDIKCNKNLDDDDDCSFGLNGDHTTQNNIIRDATKRGLKVATDNTQILDNRISNSGGDGIRIYGADDIDGPTGQNCVVKGNNLSNNGEDAGLELEGSHCLVEDNRIIGNENEITIGILIKGKDNDVVNNLVGGHETGIVLDNEEVAGNFVDSNTLRRNAVDVDNQGDDSNTGNNL